MNPTLNLVRSITRRHFLRDCRFGLGGLTLASLWTRDGLAAPVVNPLAPKAPHFAPKAKRVIFLHMTGGPPHLDLFDYKPKLVELNDRPAPEEFIKGRRFAFTSGVPKLLGTPHKFAQYGHSGAWLSDAVQGLADIVDDVCFVKSMHTDQFNHAPAEMLLYTGSPRMGRPAMGSWAIYGLGSENQNLPGFVVLLSGGSNPSAGKSVWGSGFLSSVYQGVQCRSQGDPVLYLSDPKGLDRPTRRLSLDALKDLNQMQAEELGDPETEARIAQYELAFRMQTAAPEVMDISRESPETLAAYGAQPGAGGFANNCLLARRMVEQGVRFVQLFDWGWDFHGTSAGIGITTGLTDRGQAMTKPVSALLKDLKAHGLLQETLVIWGGEFGRTPFREGRTAQSAILGRDHYPDCYTMFLAGGGIKAGLTYGETDELGFSIVRDKVHVHDLQATIMHLLGFNHERLTYRYQGRDFRLTDVHGQVVQGILA